MAHWRELLAEVNRERYGSLLGYAHLFTPDRASAEDLVQEALTRTFARPRPFEDVPAAEAYVRRAIRTISIDGARARGRWRSRAHLFPADAPVAGPEAAVATALDVAAALTRLSPRQRACVVLRHYDDLPVADIAAELGLSAGTVRRYLADAAVRLRALLDVDTTDDDTFTHLTITPTSGSPR